MLMNSRVPDLADTAGHEGAADFASRGPCFIAGPARRRAATIAAGSVAVPGTAPSFAYQIGDDAKQ